MNNDFMETVRAMRDAQNQYYLHAQKRQDGKQMERLQRALSLEKKVDKMLEAEEKHQERLAL